jgi:hypothetical protein
VLGAILLAAAALAAVPTKRGRYRGTTRQHQTLSLKTSRKGIKFSITWSANCRDGGPRFTGTTSNSKPLRVRRRGAFSAKATFQGAAADGTKVRYQVAFKGKVRRKRASGSWRLSVSGPYIEGGTYTCTTGSVGWRAKRRKKGGSAQAARGNSLGMKTKTSSRGHRHNPGATTPKPKPKPPGTFVPLGPSPPGTPAGQINQKVSGDVTYDRRTCRTSGTTKTPLSSARIDLVPTQGNTVQARLDDAGHFQTTDPVSGTLPVKAYLVLDGPRVKVKPDTNLVSDAYQISLGDVIVSKVTSGTQTIEFKPLHVAAGAAGSDPGIEAATGAANIYSQLAHGAKVVDGATPQGVTIPKITARWRWTSDFTTWLGDDNPSRYVDGADQIIIGGHHTPPTQRDEYEQYVVLHEYAHHVIKYVADPGPTSTGPTHGAHNTHTVHPPFPLANGTTDSPGNDLPALPWSEGFADSIVAAVTGDPTPSIGCEDTADYTQKPAVGRNQPGDPLEAAPKAPFQHLAQYNETAIGGVLWGLLNKLGNGKPAAGLAPLFAAFHKTVPHSMRQAREALVKDGSIETTADQDQEISEIFADQGIGWGFRVGGANGPDYFQLAATPELQGRITGPYGTCVVTDEGSTDRGGAPADFIQGDILAGTGGIPYAWQDDCFSNTDGTPDGDFGSGDGAAIVLFPYDGASGNGEFTVSERFTCSGDAQVPCPASLHESAMPISAGYRWWRTGHAPPNLVFNELVFHPVNVTLPLNQWVDIARIDEQGRCTSLVDKFDCSF